MATDPLAVERQLVERARVDAEAFAELYRTYLDRVHSYAFRRTGNRAAAEDICSSTFESALRNIDRFQWRPGGFAPWLFRIAANEVIAHHRREARPGSERGQQAMARMHEPTTEDDLSGLFGDDEQLREALSRLTPRYQRAIDLRYLAGLEPEDAARAAGLTKAALAVVLSRALKALRREVDRIEARP